MFEIGEQVLYGAHGVCCVTDMEKKFTEGKHLTYLVLEPMEKDGSKYLIPTHNASAMGKLRPLLTKEELRALLDSEEVRADCWIQNENQRKQSYRELLGGGECARLMRMVHSLYRHRTAQAAAGRKCHLCDENFLRDAERLLSSEVAIVMEMEPVQARQYIRDVLHP